VATSPLKVIKFGVIVITVLVSALAGDGVKDSGIKDNKLLKSARIIKTRLI
jgi:hypothetical protein